MSSLSVSAISASDFDSQNEQPSPQTTRNLQIPLHTAKVSAPRLSRDRVRLSAAAQAKQLYSSGQSVKQIAASLALDVKTIESYLGLNDTTEALLLATKG